MLTVVLAVAIAGVALLAVAVLTGNSVVALLAIVLALVGLVLLARDWLQDRRQLDTELREPPRPDADDGTNGHFSHDESLEPDMFEPDVAYEEDEEAEAADDDASGAGRASGST